MRWAKLQGSREKYIMRTLMICAFTEYYSDYQTENNEIVGVFSSSEERRSVYRV